MLTLTIPGGKTLQLSHLVLDYNGTIACDGRLIDGVKGRLLALAKSLTIHVVTADTFGSVREALTGIPCRLIIIPVEHQAEAKRARVAELKAASCVCVGNGRNDRLMLEGVAVEAVLAADILVSSVLDALDLLMHPLRLTATLRS